MSLANLGLFSGEMLLRTNYTREDLTLKMLLLKLAISDLYKTEMYILLMPFCSNTQSLLL